MICKLCGGIIRDENYSEDECHKQCIRDWDIFGPYYWNHNDEGRFPLDPLYDEFLADWLTISIMEEYFKEINYAY